MVGILLGVLLLIQLIGSPVATSIANRKLAALGEYHGQVGAVRLELWRGAIVTRDFELFHRGQEAEGPVIKLGHGSLAIAPLALLRGRLAGRATVRDVEVAIIHDAAAAAKKESKDQENAPAKEEGPERPWQAKLQEGFPIELTHFEVTKLKIRVVDRAKPLEPQMVIDDFHLVASDLRTRPKSAGDLPAKLDVTGHFSGGGSLKVEATGEINATQPHFKAAMEIKDLALVPLHDFLASAAKVDVTRGTFELYVEVEASGGHYDGYVKPFFQDLEFEAVPDPETNMMQKMATKVASAVTDLLENDKGEVATKAPFKGDFADGQVDIWTTIENLLRNAFITALRTGFEGQNPG